MRFDVSLSSLRLAMVALSAIAFAGASAGEEQKTAAPATGGPSGTAWSAEVAPSGADGISLDQQQTETVKKISQYFNDLTTLTGNFLQTTSDQKQMKGKFQVQRPGKFRFDYNRPSRQIIISDGEYLAIQDHDLNNEDRVSLDQTPFRLLLRKEVDLVRDARITEVQQADDLIVVALQDKSPDTPGRIKLFMATQPALELKEWITTDAQGVETRVELSDVVKGQTIDAAQFKIQTLTANPLNK